MYYFASDIHLGAGGEAFAQQTERLFVRWLDDAAQDAEAIFLVGDVFDFWFEYRGVVPKGFVRTLGKLAELTDRGIRVVFFTGNHDMWVGDYLARECGVEIHTSPQQFCLNGKNVFIAHGDNMNIDSRCSNSSIRYSARGRCAGSFRGCCIPTWRCASGTGGAASRANRTVPRNSTFRLPSR